MSKVYRVYRKRTTVEYIDVEANNAFEARRDNWTRPTREFTATDKGLLDDDTLVTTPDAPIQGNQAFIDRHVKYLMEQPTKETK